MISHASSQTLAQHQSLKLRLNYAPDKQDSIFLVISEKPIQGADSLLSSVESEPLFRTKIKKALYVKRITTETSDHRGIPAGHHHAYLFISMGKKGAAGATLECMEQRIHVSPLKPSELSFSLVNELACVEIFVKDGSSFVIGADIRVDKQPNTFVSKGEKPTIVHLPVGTYAVSALYKSSHIKLKLEVSDPSLHTLELNLTQAELLLESPVTTAVLNRSVFGSYELNLGKNCFKFDPDFTYLYENLEKVESEIRSVMDLSHDGILRVEKMHRNADHLLLQEESFEHRPLSDILASNHALQDKHFVHIMRSVLQTLSDTHRKGMVHRGLHAFHIMIGRGGRVKICDFGFFSLLESSIHTEPIVKTLLSPEQLGACPSDVRTDVFFISKLLFLILTGKNVHSTTNGLNFLPHEIQAMLSNIKLKVSDEIKSWIVQGLSVDPMQRPQDLFFIMKSFLSMP